MQCRQDTRTCNPSRIGSEHARHIAPYLEAPGIEFGGQVRSRRIRTTTTQQHGLASRIARDEALRNRYLSSQLLAQCRIGLESTSRREISRPGVPPHAFISVKNVPGVAQIDRDALPRQPCGTQGRGHELPLRHYSGPETRRSFANQFDS